jgi:hypothetical protein
MKKLSMPFISCAVASGLIVAGGLSASAQTLALQLQAINYNPGTGVWLDSSGNNNNAQFLNGTTPTFDVGVTPDMLSAVNIVGANASYGVGSHFSLLNPITAGSGYTVFAYVQPSKTDTRTALTGGSSGGALEWDIYGGHDDLATELRSFPQRVSVCLIWLLILPIIPLSSMDLLTAAGLVYRLVLPLLKLATMKEAVITLAGTLLKLTSIKGC